MNCATIRQRQTKEQLSATILCKEQTQNIAEIFSRPVSWKFDILLTVYSASSLYRALYILLYAPLKQVTI